MDKHPKNVSKIRKKTSYTLLCAKIWEISTMIFRKIYHAELEISLYRHNLSKELSQLTDWKTYKKLASIKNYCSNIVVMFQKKFRKISHSELVISLYLYYLSKEASKLRDWLTYMKLRIILILCTTFQECLQKV